MDPPLSGSLLRYVKAYERKDLDAIEAMLAPAVRLDGWHIAAQGAAAVLDATRKNFQAARDIAIEVVQVFAAACGAAAQLRIVVDCLDVPHVVDVLSFDNEGRIAAIPAFKG